MGITLSNQISSFIPSSLSLVALLLLREREREGNGWNKKTVESTKEFTWTETTTILIESFSRIN